MVPAETVLFAIQAGVRLYRSVRQADADATRAAGIVLPLPRAPAGDYAAARTWFDPVDGQGRAVATDEVRAILALQNPTAAQQQRLVDLYAQLWPAVKGAADLHASPRELVAILTVQQWAKGEDGAPRSPLQTVAGEVVNVAVDFFAHTPGAVSTKRPEGRALLAALEALDDTDFAGKKLDDVAGAVVLAVVGAVSKSPDLVGGGERSALLVKGVASALAASAAEHLQGQLPSGERWRAATWLHLVGAAVLEGGIETIAAHPDAFLGAGADPKKTVLFDVARTMADLVVGDDHRVAFRALLSGDGLDHVVRAAVASLAENPDALGPDRRGLRTILLAVATDVLADPAGLPKDLGPELVRLVLEKTAANAEVVWPGGAADPAKHLLLVAAKAALGAIAEKPPAGAWRPKLSRAQVLGVVETVLGEVVANPQWVTGKAGKLGEDVRAAVAAALAALSGVPAGQLSAEGAAAVLRAALLAVATRRAWLDRLPDPAAAQGRVAVEAAIAAVVDSVFDADASADAQWNLARAAAVTAMVEIALAVLARKGSGPDEIAALRAFVERVVAAGEPFDAASFEKRLVKALA